MATNLEKHNSSLLIGVTDYISLKLAINSAENGKRVWHISMKPIEKLPENISQPCREVLQLITFIYLSTYDDLIKHFNSIHKWKHLPQLIILKDFENYCDILDSNYNSLKSAYLCATLLDSVSYISRKSQSHTSVMVCCSSLEGTEKIQVLYDMYFDICVNKEEFQDEDVLLHFIWNSLIKTNDVS
ncbi:uncharacterized protein LOC143203967 [Rhynchophorus ferrugineus]|uniref:Uncharacterized protein n=1 Tax=Rhynchophorus ferrugineus TaxID=354439 RepID=A0A834M0D9_RHYFE|nr:hypothetical protein GWI33_020549 [Rhynchophorus ferrugineus]